MIRPSRLFLDTLKFGDRVRLSSNQRDLGEWIVGSVDDQMIIVHQGKIARRLSKDDGGTLDGKYGCRAYLAAMEP
jgi:hypothetical protein